jgi:hypothetical protein
MARGHGGVRIYDPTTPAPRPTGGLATRGALEGKRLGVLGNSKRNSDKVLEALGEMLAERTGARVVGTWHKPNTLPVGPEIAGEMAATCDLVVTGVGD